MATSFGFDNPNKDEFSKVTNHQANSNITTKEETDAQQVSFKQEFSTFTEGVSIVGLKYVFLDGANWFRKLVWLVFVIGGAVFMLYQIEGRISYFLSNPTTVNIKYNQKTSVEFPTITICSENRMTLRALDAIGSAKTLEGVFPPWDDETYKPEINYEKLYWLHQGWPVNHLEYFLADLHFVHHCLFDGAPCQPDRFVSTANGLCAQFNSYGRWSLSRAGIQYGFQVVLYANESDYGVVGGAGRGSKMLIHDKDDFPDTKNWGVYITAGWNTNFPLTVTNITSLGKPYVECDNTPGYRRTVCIAECQARYYVNECTCCPHHLPCDGLDFDRNCSYYDQVICLNNATDRWYLNGLLSECKCEQQCDYVDYPYASHSLIMSDKFANFLVDEILEPGYMTVEDAKKGYSLVNVYLAELKTEDIETKQAYPLLSLLCDIGGALGLILGSTVLTVIEFADFFLTMAWQYSHACTKRRNTKTIKVSPANNAF